MDELDKLLLAARRLSLRTAKRGSEVWKVEVRNRVKKLQFIRGDKLRPHPKNPRMHPESQVSALKGVLEEVGIAGALLVYKASDDVMTIIDGECRSANFGELSWPCLVLEVDDDEAEYLLATHDPLSALAQTDQAKLDALLEEVRVESAAVRDMLHTMRGTDIEGLPMVAGTDSPIEGIAFIKFEANRLEMTEASAGRLREKIRAYVDANGATHGLGDEIVNAVCP